MIIIDIAKDCKKQSVNLPVEFADVSYPWLCGVSQRVKRWLAPWGHHQILCTLCVNARKYLDFQNQKSAVAMKSTTLALCKLLDFRVAIIDSCRVVAAASNPTSKGFSAFKRANMVTKIFINLFSILSLHFEPLLSASSWIPADNDP